MARVPGCEAVYEVANQWRERCLEQDGSLLWPHLEEPTWTIENLERTLAVIEPLTTGKPEFWNQLDAALADTSDGIRRLTADATAIYMLSPSWYRLTNKQQSLATVSNRLEDANPKIAGLLLEAFQCQLLDVSTMYAYKGGVLTHIINFARLVKSDPNPLDVRAIVDHARNAVENNDAAHVESSNAIKHILAPEHFEAIAIQKIRGKEQIAAAESFRDYTNDLTDLDEKLAAIRTGLIANGTSPDFSFYDDCVEAMWQDSKRSLVDASPGLRSFEGVTIAPAPLIDALNKASLQLIDAEILPDGWPYHTGTSVEELAEKVFSNAAELTEIETLLSQKKQLVLEGPPGTGKTFVARLFARYLAGLPLLGGRDPQVEIVQFHQSYGYEDFVAGIRPSTTPEGTIRYDVQPGIFIEMCKRAEANPDRNFILIIDEINRGNVSRIFGELLYALEYRDEPVRMQYPDLLGDVDADHLIIPGNLYLIGTMNSTDRSLAMIDYALRRRFYFWKLAPVVEGRAPFLEGWLRSKSFEPAAVENITRRFVEINVQISSYLTPDYAIGHSYFMDEEIGQSAGRARIWTYQLQPLLEEYFHNRRDRDDAIATLRDIMLGS